MRDNVLWRKKSHIIMMLAEKLGISSERALDLFYSTETCRQLTDMEYGIHLMSDQYIVDNVINEITNNSSK